MTSDLPDMIIGGKGELAGAIPHLLGYRPEEQSVVVLGLQGNRLGPLAATTSPDVVAHGGFPSQASAGFARQVGQAFTRYGVTTSIVVGYGADGPGRARLVAEALDSYVSPNHEVACWSVDRGQVRSWDREVGGWSKPELVDSGAEWVLRGSAPADSRHDMVDSFQPQPAQAWAPLSSDQQQELAALPEADQVGLARDVVRQLTEPGAGAGPHEYAWLGALINGPVGVRDAVLGATVTSPGGVEALRAALVGAPECYRDGLTAVTAATVYVRGHSSELAHELVDRVNPTGPHARLAGLVRTSLNMGLDPRGLQRAIVAADRDADDFYRSSPAPSRATRALDTHPPVKPDVSRNRNPGVGR